MLTKINENDDDILINDKNKIVKLENDFKRNEIVQIADIKIVLNQHSLYL